ncbi:MAG: M20 family metallopeptidase [Spirochaetaceae bacterium]
MDIGERAAELKEEVISLRRDFHTYPELGFQEYRTAEKVEEYLRGLGLEPQRVAETGVTAVLKGEADGAKDGPVLLLRADMDALPITEENAVPYVSRNLGVMHACGHDGHTAMLLVAAKMLSEIKEHLAGTIKFVFQPNEEIAGAEIMVEEGVLEDPEPDAALGFHIWTPLPSGTVGLKAGAVMASMDVFKITVKGKGGHTGFPESAVDPIVAAADMVKNVQILQTREVSAMKPTIIMFGKIAGGTKNNIIPDEVLLEGSMRYLYEGGPESEENPALRLRRIAENVAAVHRCRVDFEIEQENYAVVNSAEMTDLMRETAAQMDSVASVVEHASMAGEDFAAFSSRIPSAFVFLGTANQEKGTDYPHHNPKFNIDEETLPLGVEMCVRSTLQFFSKEERKGGVKEGV